MAGLAPFGDDPPLSPAEDAIVCGDWSAAREAIAQRAEPQSADSLQLLAVTAAGEGSLEEAASLLRRALALHPGRAEWHRDLGVVLAAAGDGAAAAEAFGQALALQPDNESALRLRARALLESRQYDAALDAYLQAKSALPCSAEVFLGLGRTLMALRELEEAIDAFHEGMALAPDFAKWHDLLGECHLAAREHAMELFHREEAVRLRPSDPVALARRAVAYGHIGDIHACVSGLREVVALDPSSRHTHSALLNALLHHPDSTPETILEEHMRWARTHCGPARPRDFTNSRDVNRKLRIGYISGEATSAQTFCFMSPIIKNHDRSRFEVVYYNAQPHHNERTGEYQRWVAGWREVAGLTETEQADLVRGGRIDIFADLSGHYGYSALPVAAMRVAPVQVAFPNYPSTTGVAEIDYMFTDRWTSPAECEKHYAERLYRVPSGYLAYAPPACAPAVSELPALRSGAVTFGFFQRASKLNAGVYDAIARVLHGVPRSRLLVHFSSVDLDEEGSGMRSRIAGALAARGIAAGRIEFAGSRGLDRSLALMGEADIALDSFPYNGQTTTCECLWMGVPVVTLAGGAHAGRVGAALLSRVGLPGWVAAGVADYVEIASRAAADLPALAVLRAGLRDRVAASSLADGPRICREIEDAYRWMWKCWCLEPAGGNECQTTAK